MFFHLAGGGGGGGRVMTVDTVENNHLSICFPLFPSPLLPVFLPVNDVIVAGQKT